MKYQSGDATREQLLKELNIDIVELKRGLKTVKEALIDLAQEQATRELSGTNWLNSFANKLFNETNIGVLVQLADKTYKCTCGGKPEYVGSEWKWECPKCGAKNYT